MKRVLYWLLLPTILLAVWLLLNKTLAPGQVVLGAVLSLLLAWAAMALRPMRSTPRRPLLLIKLVFIVIWDSFLANIAVAKLILRGSSSFNSSFVEIPLDLEEPHGLAALSCIVTYTPGTVWAGYSEEHHRLTLHVLDLKDEQEVIDFIKNRYERPLLEIFQ